jgi:hypothetical protein
MFVDLRIEGIFGQHPDKLAPHKFRNLKLNDPIIADKYRKILHTQFEHQNGKSLHGRSKMRAYMKN